MADAVAAVLAYAVGVGLSPIPIVAGIVVLLSGRAEANGPSFLAGWLLGLAATVTSVLLVADRLGAGPGGAAEDEISWLRVALGAVLVVAAARKWRRRDAGVDDREPPAWMARAEGLDPARSLGFGLVLSLNPKNLALGVGAGTALAELDATAFHAALAVVLYVVVGSGGLVLAVVSSLWGGPAARLRLDTVRSWLLLHDRAVLAAIYLVFGALLISGGLEGAS